MIQSRECDGTDEGAVEHGCEVCPECGFHNDHSLSCESGNNEGEDEDDSVSG